MFLKVLHKYKVFQVKVYRFTRIFFAFFCPEAVFRFQLGLLFPVSAKILGIILWIGDGFSISLLPERSGCPSVAFLSMGY